MQNVNKTKITITIEQHGGDIYETEINKRELIIDSLHTKAIALSFIELHLLYKRNKDDFYNEMLDSCDKKRAFNDQNGNGRYIIHFLALLNDEEKRNAKNVDAQYKLALKKSRVMGGAVYRGRDYGGGIVFYDSYSGEREEMEHLYKVKHNLELNTDLTQI